MTLTEAIQAAKHRGFRHVQTGGGWVPLDHWAPYGGIAEVELHWYEGADSSLDGRALCDRIMPTPTGLFLAPITLGIWPLR